jgi:hypothetical protein
VVAIVAVEATARLFAMNPVHELTENWLFGAHSANSALPVLRKNANRSQSYRFYCATRSNYPPSGECRHAQPEDGERKAQKPGGPSYCALADQGV